MCERYFVFSRAPGVSLTKLRYIIIVVALLIGLIGDENAGLLIRLVNDQHYWCIHDTIVAQRLTIVSCKSLFSRDNSANCKNYFCIM